MGSEGEERRGLSQEGRVHSEQDREKEQGNQCEEC